MKYLRFTISVDEMRRRNWSSMWCKYYESCGLDAFVIVSITTKIKISTPGFFVNEVVFDPTSSAMCGAYETMDSLVPKVSIEGGLFEI